MLVTWPHRQVTSVSIMEFITIFFIAMVVGTIVLAPRFGAESRPGFLRADLSPRASWSPARPWSNDR
jgi:hypothetical protein